MEVDRELATLAVRAAEERKATDVLLLDLKSMTLVADYFLIASATSGRQVKAIAENIVETLSRSGLKPLHREGWDGQRWVLIDFGGLVCHVFNQADRDFYGLERLWGDAPRVSADGDAAPGQAPARVRPRRGPRQPAEA